MKSAVLITGAGSGIGASTAKEFSRQGHFVYLLGRNEKNLNAVASLCKESKVLLCDLANAFQVRQAALQALEHSQGKLEVLVNNAGIFARHSTPEGTDEIWKAQFEVNLLGPVRLTRELWPAFVKQGRGSILNVSSTLGVKPSAETSAYSAVKAAMINWTQALAMEGGPHGIRANCVAPGIVDTPIHGFHTLAEGAKSEALKSMAALQPLGRIGSPDEIAKAIYFLASPESPWTTGATLNVDGGIHLA